MGAVVRSELIIAAQKEEPFIGRYSRRKSDGALTSSGLILNFPKGVVDGQLHPRFDWALPRPSPGCPRLIVGAIGKAPSSAVAVSIASGLSRL